MQNTNESESPRRLRFGGGRHGDNFTNHRNDERDDSDGHENPSAGPVTAWPRSHRGLDSPSSATCPPSTQRSASGAREARLSTANRAAHRTSDRPGCVLRRPTVEDGGAADVVAVPEQMVAKERRCSGRPSEDEKLIRPIPFRCGPATIAWPNVTGKRTT